MGKTLGASDQLLKSFGATFSKEAAERAGLLTMTPEERQQAEDRKADNARQAAAGARTAAPPTQN